MSEYPYPGSTPPGDPTPYTPRPLSPQDERTWALLAHLSAILGSLVSLPFLGPLVIYLVLRDRGDFVRGHAAEALNMTLSVIIYVLGLAIPLGVLSLVTFGASLVLLAVPPVAALVCCILAAVAASSGRVYRYPLVIRMVR